jgi:carbamoyltransferase
MTFILGINAFHADAAAALVKDGRIVGAVEEERFRRIKHWAGFPTEAVKWCLDEAGIKIADIDHIAINTQPNAHRLRRILYVMKTRPDLKFLIKRWRNKKERNNLQQQLSISFPNDVINAQLHFVEHHRSHLASAFYASPFLESSVVSVDGFGDFASSAWGYGSGTKIREDGHVFFPHSLGAYYTAITQYLGFPNYGDEYKVMGLAPYGKPTYLTHMRQMVKIQQDGTYELNLKYFQHSGKKNIDHQWSSGTPTVGRHWSEQLEELLGPARQPHEKLEQKHMDIAISTQAMYEEAFFALLNSIHQRDQSQNVCVAGGCGANSVANGKITSHTEFKHVYVQAAAGDAGGALGAALDVWHQLSPKRCEPMLNAYLGCKSSNTQIKSLLDREDIRLRLETENCSVDELDDETLTDIVSDALIRGEVIGWFEGKMEWGPRALGHRSILGDPRRSDMKDILNLKIKRRESFRPFAPSVLREAVNDWFVFDAEVPFMMQVFLIKTEKRALIPAVTHVDGSGRLQTVSADQNGRYYKLIRCFHKKTSVPMVLNTSFNENEPIVCKIEEALDCFLRTKMDVLVAENWLIRRRQ